MGHLLIKQFSKHRPSGPMLSISQNVRVTKLKNSNSVKSQKLKMWQKSKLKLWENSKTQIGTKLNKSGCAKTAKLKLRQSSTTQIGTKLTSKIVKKTQIVTKLQQSNCGKTQILTNLKTLILTLLKKTFISTKLKT